MGAEFTPATARLSNLLLRAAIDCGRSSSFSCGGDAIAYDLANMCVQYPLHLVMYTAQCGSQGGCSSLAVVDVQMKNCGRAKESTEKYRCG